MNWDYIHRGKVGWCAETDNCSSSGGTLEGYLKESSEGALVSDAEEADYEVFAKHVYHSPMLDTTLGPFEESRFGEKDRDSALVMSLPGGLSGGYRTLALMAQDKNYSGLDKVGIGIYTALLKKIPGMKIGKVVNGKVEWEIK